MDIWKLHKLESELQSCQKTIQNFTSIIEIQKRKLNLNISKKIGQLDNSKHLARDVSKIGHFGKGDYQVQVEDDRDLEYIMSLIRQVIQ